MTIPTDNQTAGVFRVVGGRNECARGALAMFPLAVGYVPFGLLLGAAVARSADPMAAWAGAPMIYGGSAHLAVVELLRSDAGLLAATGAALLINVRLLVYSSALIPLWSSAALPARMLAAAVVVDPTWMVAERRAGTPGGISQRRAHFAGAAITLTVGWILAITAGVALGSVEGLATLLAVAIPLCLTAIVAPHLRVSGGWWAVGAAAAVAVPTRCWPAGTGMLLAMAAAAVAGGLVARRSS